MAADPSELLDVVRFLSDPNGPTPPTDAHLRKAVSSAYYALFHTVLRAAAERFMGPGQERSPAYTILYRSFDHGEMRRVCEAIKASTLSRKYQDALGRTVLGTDIREFAALFPLLQDARHTADYDPRARFVVSDVATLLREVERAIEAFHAAPPAERTDVLALLMVRAR